MYGRIINMFSFRYRDKMHFKWILRTDKGKIILDTVSKTQSYFYLPVPFFYQIKPEIDKILARSWYKTSFRPNLSFSLAEHNDLPVIKVIVNDDEKIKAVRANWEDTVYYPMFYESDIPIEARALIDNEIYNHVQFDDKWNYSPLVDKEKLRRTPEPKTLIYDIESDDREGYADMKNKRILSIAYIDANTGERSFVIADEDDSTNVLTDFWTRIQDYDFLVAWNGDGYDHKILQHQLKTTGIVDHPEWRYWQWLDYMKLFIKYDAKFSSKRYLELAVPAELYLGISKIIHDESFYEMFENQILGKNNKLELYNMRDVDIIYGLEKRFNFLFLMNTISDVSGLEIGSCMYNTRIIETLVFRLSRMFGYVWRPRPTKAEKEARPTFRGAWVEEPVFGLHDVTIIEDYTSLYNRIMQSKNISPETWSPKLNDFSFEKKGIFPTILETLEIRRNKYKDLKKHAGTDKDRQTYDILQYAMKFLLLSFYGVIGAKHSRFFVKEIAERITGWGRILIAGNLKKNKEIGCYNPAITKREYKGAKQIVNELILITPSGKKITFLVVYGDTDSIFILVICEEELSKAEYLWIAKEIVKETNIGMDVILADQGVPIEYRKINMELQGIYKSFLVTKKKKKHAEYMWFDPELNDGKGKWLNPPRLDYKGFEMKKSDREPFTASLQEALIHRVLSKENPIAITTMLSETKKRFMAGEFDDMLTIKSGTKPNLDSYIVNQPHVRAAKKLRAKNLYLAGQSVEYVFTNFGEETIYYMEYINEEGKKKKTELDPDSDIWIKDDSVMGKRLRPDVKMRKVKRIQVEPVIEGIISEISDSGLATYWNNRIYSWIRGIMEVLVDVNEFDETVGEILLTKAGTFKTKIPKSLKAFF